MKGTTFSPQLPALVLPIHTLTWLPLRRAAAAKAAPAADALAMTHAQPNGMHHESSAINLSNITGVSAIGRQWCSPSLHVLLFHMPVAGI